MAKSVPGAVREGVEFGLCAGLSLMLAEVVTDFVQRKPLFNVLRQVARNLFGQEALESVSQSAVVMGCVAAHLAMAAVFGVVYALLNRSFSDRTQTRWDRQAAIGIFFGAAVWAVKFQIIARFVEPAFLADTGLQFTQLVLHTFFYGWPLALFYASAERRLRPLRRAMQGV